MNKYSNKILKYINKMSSEENPIEDSDIYKEFDFDEDTINNSLKFLENEHKIVRKNRFHSYANVLSGYSLYYSTTSGKDYFKDLYRQKIFNILKEFIRSIFCPIIVAFLTTLIALYLNN